VSPARGTRANRTTYTDIQRWVAETYGYRPETAWIAHVKALCGLTPRPAPNRGAQRRRLCPPEKQAQIAAALRHFELIPERPATR
jgi:hypothetical protein